jgi:hypothetical protein
MWVYANRRERAVEEHESARAGASAALRALPGAPRRSSKTAEGESILGRAQAQAPPARGRRRPVRAERPNHA